MLVGYSNKNDSLFNFKISDFLGQQCTIWDNIVGIYQRSAYTVDSPESQQCLKMTVA